MASAFHHVFKWDNTAMGGGSDDDSGKCPAIGDTSPAKNYSKTFVMPSQSKDFAFCAICTFCDCKMSIEMSPDGVNWCDCVDAAQDACKDISCSVAAGTCNCKVVNAPMMQYVRVVLHDGSASGGACKVTVHWTTF